MAIQFDINGILDDPSLNMLTKDIIRARGVDASDNLAVFALCKQLAETSLSLSFMSIVDMDDLEDLNSIENTLANAQTYDLLAKYMARDVNELVKYLYFNGFIFHEE